MIEENSSVTDIVEVNKKGAAAKAFFKKYSYIFYWIPVALSCVLGIVLLLAPLAYLLPSVFELLGLNITGYDVFKYMEVLEAGFAVPVILIMVIGIISVIVAVLGIVLHKFRRSIFCDILTCIFTVATFAIGVGQAAWIGSLDLHPGAFSILCIVFGIVFALMAIGETIIHWLFIASQEDKILWGLRFKKYKGWLYLAPALIILAIFTVWPIINTIRMSFLKDYSGLAATGGATFEFGFDNFVNVAKYKRFMSYLGNTMLLTVITVPISTMLALLIAVALNSIKWVKKTFQTIFFLPYVTNSIAIGMVFMAMFTMIGGTATQEPISVGIINKIIEAFGGHRINWVNGGSSKLANMVVLITYIVWNALPFKILILLGGLQSVNKQYYDAAKVDGTSRFRTFWRITVPLLSPMIAYVVITGFIGGFKEYSSIVGIFGDSMGPVGDANRLNTIVGFIYENIEGTNVNQGRASAAALILFAIIFAVTMINMYVSKKKVHY